MNYDDDVLGVGNPMHPANYKEEEDDEDFIPLNTGQMLRKRIERLGLKESEVLRKANVSHTLINNWVENEPKTLRLLARIEKELRNNT